LEVSSDITIEECLGNIIDDQINHGGGIDARGLSLEGYCSLLQCYTSINNLQAVESIVRSGADVNATNGTLKQTPLNLATNNYLMLASNPQEQEDAYKIIKLLVNHGADYNKRDEEKKDHSHIAAKTPLFLVANNPQGMILVRYFLQQPNINLYVQHKHNCTVFDLVRKNIKDKNNSSAQDTYYRELLALLEQKDAAKISK
jgi:hypothetical protein